MSRIGRMAIAIPKEAKIEHEGQRLVVQGPNGKLDIELPVVLKLSVSDKEIKVERSGNSKPIKAAHGLYRALIANMVQGVTTPFVKQLEIQGVGYRAESDGKQLNLQLGFSHTVVLPIPEGIQVSVDRNTMVRVEGIDRQQVGQFAADIRAIRPPEPYKGKGIRYLNEHVRRKVGKSGVTAGG